MNSKVTKDQEPISYQTQLDNLQEEVQSLRVRLAEAEELKRAISEGDLDALVLPGPEGEMVFTLSSADHAYRVLVETMNEGTATLDRNGTILYCNRQFAELLRAPLQTIVSTSIYRFIALESTITFETLMERERGKEEINLRAEGGISLPVDLSISPFQTDGYPNAWCIVLTDLTEKKKNEEIRAHTETIRKKEIHHRIKNNLQVISSLLDLQAEKFKNRECIKDSEVLEAFRESQNRVISMALIHEELHEGEGDDTLNFSLYLEKLIESLFQTYWLGNTDINLNIDVKENLFFDMDTAVPLGIIINELVSNSFKHAFIGRDKGEIRIKLYRERSTEFESEDCESNSFTLTVSDDGVGIPKSLDLENPDTLGIQLVASLVDQLDGEFGLKRNNETEFTIRFIATKINKQIEPNK
ncbi:MAG: PAS domain-containing protein [Alphaproteobacteria bacterium]|nr:MAG: PAS domain-containing protein [Alphaproteobacteria bacterium]